MESQHKGRNALSVRSTVVDWMKNWSGISALCFHQCFWHCWLVRWGVLPKQETVFFSRNSAINLFSTRSYFSTNLIKTHIFSDNILICLSTHITQDISS